MRLVFLGTPDLSAFILEEIINHHYIPQLVITKEDAIAGRGMKTKYSAVKQTAYKYQLPLMQANSLKNNTDIVNKIKELAPDYIIVVAYGCILTQEILSIASCINVHASLLPKWRGAAPIPRSLLAGDKETGITIMQMDQGLDTGDILLQEKIIVDNDETHGSLYHKMKIIGAKALIKYLDTSDHIQPIAQNNSLATYANKIQKQEGLIDFNQLATKVELHIRGFNPPGAYSYLDGKLYKIWEAEVVELASQNQIELKCFNKPGCIVQANQDGLIVCCGLDGIKTTFLKIHSLQIAGGIKQDYRALIRNNNFLGKIFTQSI